MASTVLPMMGGGGALGLLAIGTYACRTAGTYTIPVQHYDSNRFTLSGSVLTAQKKMTVTVTGTGTVNSGGTVTTKIIVNGADQTIHTASGTEWKNTGSVPFGQLSIDLNVGDTVEIKYVVSGASDPISFASVTLL